MSLWLLKTPSKKDWIHIVREKLNTSYDLLWKSHEWRSVRVPCNWTCHLVHYPIHYHVITVRKCTPHHLRVHHPWLKRIIQNNRLNFFCFLLFFFLSVADGGSWCHGEADGSLRGSQPKQMSLLPEYIRAFCQSPLTLHWWRCSFPLTLLRVICINAQYVNVK